MAILPAEVKSINKKDRTVDLMDGRKIPLPDDLAFEFMGSESAKQKQEDYRQSVHTSHEALSNIPIIGEHIMPAIGGHMGLDWLLKLADKGLSGIHEGVSSIVPAKGQEDMSYFQRFGENFEANMKGRQKGFEEIGKEHPYAKKIGQGTGIVSSFLAPGPKNPVSASVLMGAGLSDTNPIQNPMGAIKETALDAVLGYGLGKATKGLENIANERKALRNYPELLQKHKDAATNAEKKYISEMARKLDAVDTELRGGISKGVIQIDDFINQNIGMSPIASTPQGKNLSSFFSTLVKSAPENMNASDLKKIFGSIESRIATSAAEEIPILTSFKEYLVHSLPIGAASNAVKNKFGKKIFNSFEKQIDKSVSNFLSDKSLVTDLKRSVGREPIENLANDLTKFSKSGYEKLSPIEFVKDLNNGNLKDRLMWYIDNNQKLSQIEQKLEETLNHLQSFAPLANLRSQEIQNLVKARNKIQIMKQAIGNNISNSIISNSVLASNYERDIIRKVSSKISNAVGVQNPFTSIKPTNMQPISIPAPNAPQTGRLSPFFENPNFYSDNLKKLTSLRGTGGLAKSGYLMTGVPKAKMVLTAGALAAGLTSALRGVTSPTVLGSFAREGIQKGGMRLIVDSIAEKYPSYQNGILQDPQERRSAVAEIEQDPDLGLEDKAILQAKINRGQSIEKLIKE